MDNKVSFRGTGKQVKAILQSISDGICGDNDEYTLDLTLNEYFEDPVI